jgi:pimeloyl-ACP methyl ester carboxylesterase
LQDGPVILVGHSYGGIVITEAGNDPKVVGLVYVAAWAPAEGESLAILAKRYPPAPLGDELRPDKEGFLTVTAKGIAEDFAQDLSDTEKQLVTATQGPTNAAAFGATVTTAAWKSKPSWFVIAAKEPRDSPGVGEGRSRYHESYLNHITFQSRGHAFPPERSGRTNRTGRGQNREQIAVSRSGYRKRKT